jgi:hypothetical protein
MNEKVRKYTAEEFAKEYEELCERAGFRIVCQPIWVTRDDGTFSTVLTYTVGIVQKNNQIKGV